jgi:hypothetical protein
MDENVRAVLGIADVELDGRGLAATRILPDGREAAVAPLLFNRGRLTVGERPGADAYDDAYDYEDLDGALRALDTWDPESEEEPSGWVRATPSNRRRPDGDPEHEYVLPGEAEEGS